MIVKGISFEWDDITNEFIPTLQIEVGCNTGDKNTATQIFANGSNLDKALLTCIESMFSLAGEELPSKPTAAIIKKSLVASLPNDKGVELVTFKNWCPVWFDTKIWKIVNDGTIKIEKESSPEPQPKKLALKATEEIQSKAGAVSKTRTEPVAKKPEKAEKEKPSKKRRIEPESPTKIKTKKVKAEPKVEVKSEAKAEVKMEVDDFFAF